MPMMKDLQLTDDQAAAIERVTRDGCDASQPLAEQNGELRGALQAAILSDARDPGKIADLVARIGAIEQQLLDVHVRTHVAIADVLTAEQRAKLRAGK
jgi:Spy/CpxP family protein refolding chaperone